MKSARISEEIHRWSSEPEEVARLTNRKEALYREIVAQAEIAPLPGAAEWLVEAGRATLVRIEQVTDDAKDRRPLVHLPLPRDKRQLGPLDGARGVCIAQRLAK